MGTRLVTSHVAHSVRRRHTLRRRIAARTALLRSACAGASLCPVHVDVGMATCPVNAHLPAQTLFSHVLDACFLRAWHALHFVHAQLQTHGSPSGARPPRAWLVRERTRK
eukprot:364284-Chlamydomonas_euryale.AAC.11